MTLDPRTNAVRSDLADMRLASIVFAPHYAEALPRRIVAAAQVRATRDTEAETLASLAIGDVFELLDLIGDDAWGIVPSSGVVGYVPAAVLAG